MSLLAAILVFGLIILFHEFGHFLFAKLGGICVVEFSLGMGPRLFSFVKGGTRYSLKLLPFGGSCMMLGEDEDVAEDPDENPPGATGVPFHETSVWTRFSVIVAGPIFNFILAFFCSVFVIGHVGYDPAEVADVMEGYPAQEAGLLPGDVITKINDKNIKIYRDILSYTMFHKGEPLTLQYKRNGEKYETTLIPEYVKEQDTYRMGIRGGAYKKASVLKAAEYSLYELRYWVDMTFKSLGMILRREVSSGDIAGPVRIVSMIDSTVKESSVYGLTTVLINLANMCVLLSANLGIMNLLPIPALDGGRLVFILLEAVRGKPIDREKEGMVHMAGMALLMLLMVFILFNDIRNVF